MKQNLLDWINVIQSFSKRITLLWMAVWTETILFSQIAVLLQFGDVAALQVINDNVLQIGLVICSFYFGTKCVENIAKGVETYLLLKSGDVDKITKLDLENDKPIEDDNKLAKG